MSTSAKRQKISHGPGAPVARRRESNEIEGGEASGSGSKSQPSKKSVPDTADREEEEEEQGSDLDKQDDADDDAAPKSFEDLGVVESLCETCAKLGWKNPTPIQQEAIPVALKGRDVIGLAETGSGKTGAFAIPMLTGLLEKPQPLYGLVLAPTRELATQIAQAFEALGSSISLRCATIIGGLDMVSQAIALGKKPHVVVATPGRLLDHLEKTKGFSLMKLKFLVLDEADRMLDLDFSAIIEKILKFIPRERQTLLFSATMSSKVEALQRASLRDPVRVAVGSKYQTVSTLLQKYVFVPLVRKDTYLVYLANERRGQSTVVFCRTVHETQRLAFLLRALGFSAVPLHGQLSQTARLGALNKFRSGARDILVATDVAARGLDIPKVDVVLNYDLPGDSKTYIHRVGRTARAGKSGIALSIVTQYDLEIWLRIEKALGVQLEEYGLEKDEVLVFSSRVEEAQREAREEMKALDETRNGRGGSMRGRNRGGRDARGGRGGKGGEQPRGVRRRADDMDAEEG